MTTSTRPGCTLLPLALLLACIPGCQQHERSAPEATTKATVSCLASGAHYELLPDPRFRIELQPAYEPDTASDLRLRLVTPTRVHAFRFTVSNGYATTRLWPEPMTSISDDDPEFEAPGFHAFDHDMRELPGAPQSDGAAPEWLFVPALGRLLWYGWLPVEGARVDTPDAMPSGMFRRASCGSITGTPAQ